MTATVDTTTPGDTAQEAAFREQARAWLEVHAADQRAMWRGPRQYYTDAFSDDEARHLAAAKRWQRTLYDGGWAALHWPVSFGGRGASQVEAAIFEQEMGRLGAPRGLFAVGISMVGPTLMAWGTEQQQQRFLGPMLSGDEVWCQLFSEPGAGSDLAGLSCRAERDGDQFVVNGQKVWTSGAHYSDFGILLARTNAEAPKHRGITCFALDMRSPGIDVRPLRQMTGGAHFNEVFLTDVRVPAAAMIGALDDGWRTAMTTLSNERQLFTGESARDRFAELSAVAEQAGRTGDPVVRQQLAELFTRLQIFELLELRSRAAARDGAQPGPESSIMKLAMSQNTALIANFAVDVQGPWGQLAAGSDTVAAWHANFLGHWGARIGGGTDEIQRNIIGERVLGLPREPRTDANR
ncbi:MAG: hypothetical protein QOJ74_1184 [Ilumatobacteraceae bacterium]|nr:hypothetical protein [Ilumatobacteraceae bacterium]